MAAEQLSMFTGGKKTKPASGRGPGFSITKTVKAPPQKVFDQWLIPVFLEGWMFATDTVVALSNEVRRGGAFSFKVQRPGSALQMITPA